MRRKKEWYPHFLDPILLLNISHDMIANRQRSAAFLSLRSSLLQPPTHRFRTSNQPVREAGAASAGSGLNSGGVFGLLFLKNRWTHTAVGMSAADTVGSEVDAAAREAKPSTPRSILRRDSSTSSAVAEGATRKRVTFDEVRGWRVKSNSNQISRVSLSSLIGRAGSCPTVPLVQSCLPPPCLPPLAGKRVEFEQEYRPIFCVACHRIFFSSLKKRELGRHPPSKQLNRP